MNNEPNKPTPDPDDPGSEHLKQDFLNHLRDIEAENDRVTDDLDGGLQKLEKVLALVTRYRTHWKGTPVETVFVAVSNLLSAIRLRLRAARKRNARTNDLLGIVEDALGASKLWLASPFADACGDIGPRVQSVLREEEVRNRAGEVVKYVFRIDRIRVRLSAKRGRLLLALGANVGVSPDRMVAFKSRDELAVQVETPQHNLSSLINRLRDNLEAEGFSRDLLETNAAGNYRLRLLRKEPLDGSAAV